MSSVFETWLPGSLSASSAVDQAQLTALTEALAAIWEADASLNDRLTATVAWIPLVRTCDLEIGCRHHS